LIFSDASDIYVVTNEEYRFRVSDDLDDLGGKNSRREHTA
jgi:mannose-1-phosphate guanylyltransferase